MQTNTGDRRWRLIPPFAAPGSVHMAVDQWLLAQHCQAQRHRDQPLSYLRFYTWSPAAISLGYHQHRWPQDWCHMQVNGVPLEVVRRPTGGRAVLHQGDLTYSVITSAFAGQTLAIYQRICQFLIEGWQTLGVNLTYGHQQRGYDKTADCFSTPTVADLIMADGYKLIGSAQLKRDGAVLQHGSIRLAPDPSLHQHIFSTSLTPPTVPPALQTLAADTAHQIVIEALTAAAYRCFPPQMASAWEIHPLSQAELQQAMVQFGNQPSVCGTNALA